MDEQYSARINEYFRTAYMYLKKYHGTQTLDEWKQAADEASALCQAENNDEFLVKLLSACYFELSRKSKERNNT